MADLAKLFLENLSDSSTMDGVDEADIETRLSDLLNRGTTEWPDLEISGEKFVVHIAERFSASDDQLASLEAIRAEDLYLACGCTYGDQQALNLFATNFQTTVDGVLSRLTNQGVNPEDIKQQLMEHLLFPKSSDALPAIALYAGYGALGSYMRVAAFHRGLKLLEKDKRTKPMEDLEHIASLSSDDTDPELQTLKNRYKGDFKEAFQSCLSEIESRERNLLRYHYISGLTTRQISSMMGVDQSTVVRWLARVRSNLLMNTKKRLMRKLGIGDTEVHSILRLVESQLDLSIERVLQTKVK
jgi:RNA polymerase sigma-70 factor (ECF subfamily)